MCFDILHNLHAHPHTLHTHYGLRLFQFAQLGPRDGSQRKCRPELAQNSISATSSIYRFWVYYFFVRYINNMTNGGFKCRIIVCCSCIMDLVLDQEVWSHKIVSHNQGCRIIKCHIIEVRVYFLFNSIFFKGFKYLFETLLGPLYTGSQDRESPSPNKSTLNLPIGFEEVFY